MVTQTHPSPEREGRVGSERGRASAQEERRGCWLYPLGQLEQTSTRTSRHSTGQRKPRMRVEVAGAQACPSPWVRGERLESAVPSFFLESAVPSFFLLETFLGTRCSTSQQEEGCSSTARSFRTRSHPGASGFRHTGVLSVPAAQETLPDPESGVSCQRGRSVWHTG